MTWCKMCVEKNTLENLAFLGFLYIRECWKLALKMCGYSDWEMGHTSFRDSGSPYTAMASLHKVGSETLNSEGT